jgi:phytoene desaturase
LPKNVVLIGAGPGGLAAAILLARAGVSVQVFERAAVAGGRTSALEAEGFRFDLGPTFFLYPRVLEEIFAVAGHDLRQEVDLVRLDPQYRIVFGAGGEILATPDLARMQAQVASISPADASQVGRFLADNRVKLERFRPCLENPFLGWGSLLQMRLLRVLPYLKPWRSLDTELATYFEDPRIRLAFSFQSKYLGMSPFSCPSLFSILSFLEYEYGVFHPIGGCNAVTRAMARLADSLGAEIRLGDEVEEILVEHGRAVGVRTGTGRHEADAVVVNADFGRAMTRLLPERHRRRWSDARIASMRYSCSTFMMYLGIEGLCDHLPHHTIFVTEDYARNLEEIETRHVLSEDPSFYVQNACVTDASLAPAGHSTLYMLIPVTHQHPNVDWNREKDRYRRVALRQLRRIGIEGIEERIRFERIVTPADWERAEIYRGATFNLAHDFGQLLHLRPRNRFEELEGLYLVGGGTHPGSGLPVIFESARITSRLLLDELGFEPSMLEALVPTGRNPEFARAV